MNKPFSVGFADVIITPDEPMPLGGYSASSFRKHERVLEDLHAIGTAMTDSEGSTVLLVTCARLALEDRKPARMFAGHSKTHGLNIVKHYYHNMLKDLK